MSEWNQFELKDITSKIGSGATPRGGQEAYKTEGISLIRSQNILDFSFSYNGLAFIDENQADKLKNVIVEENDILINITGDSVARVTKVPQEVLPARVNQHVAILRPKQSEIDSDYLLYYLLNPFFKRLLLKIASDGATRNALTKTQLQELIIRVPSINEQKQIAKTLSNLDQKITLLRQQNQTLEQLAQTLFKRWFVEFEFPCLPQNYRFSGHVNSNHNLESVLTYKKVGGLPVPDDKNWFVYVLLCEDNSFYKGMTTDLYRRFYEHYIGEGAKHTKTHKPIKVIHWEQFNSQKEARKREEELKTGYGRTWIKREYEKFLKYGYPQKDGLPAHQTRLMMAGKMVSSELGEIPEGWKFGALSSLFDFLEGPGIRNWQYTESGVPFINIRLIKDNDIDVKGSNFVSLEEGNGKYNHFKLEAKDMVVSTSGSLGKTAIVRESHLPLLLNTSVIRFRPIGIANYPFMYQYLKSKSFERELLTLASGSVQLNFGPTHLKQIEMILPDKNVLNIFKMSTQGGYNQIIENKEQIQTLTKLRDTLLPKLMSGELKVNSKNN